MIEEQNTPVTEKEQRKQVQKYRFLVSIIILDAVFLIYLLFEMIKSFNH